MRLTVTYMVQPSVSVDALWFAHADAKTFLCDLFLLAVECAGPHGAQFMLHIRLIIVNNAVAVS